MPAQPGYCIDVPVVVPKFRYVCLFHDPATGDCTLWNEIPDGFETIIERQCFPPTPAIPPQPPIPPVPGTEGTPGTPGTPGIPAQPGNFFVGWNAGADSIRSEPIPPGDFQYWFLASANAVGVVTGVGSPINDGSYQRIEYAFYITNGTYRVMERGVYKTAPVAFNDGDAFYITRRGNQIDYYALSTRIYRSTKPTLGVMSASGALFMGQDEIYAAHLDPLDSIHSAESGTCSGVLKHLEGFSADIDGGFVQGELHHLTGHAASADDPINGISGTCNGVLKHLEGESFEYGFNYLVGKLKHLTGHGEAGLVRPQYAIVAGVLEPLTGFSVGVGSPYNVCQGVLKGLSGFAIGHTASDFFLDGFSGGATLTDHEPTDGGNWHAIGGGSTTDYSVGAGVSPSSTTGTEVGATFGSAPGSIYTVTETFTPTAAGADTLDLDLILTNTAGTVPLVEAKLEWDGATTWTLVVTVYDAAGAPLFTQSVDVTADISVGVSNTIVITVWPNGVSVALDSVTEVSTATVPGATPSALAFVNQTSGGTSNINLDSIEGQQLAPDGVEGFVYPGELHHLTGYSSDRNRGWQIGQLSDRPYPFLGLGHWGSAALGARGTLPRPQGEAHGHAVAIGTLPKGTVSATGTLVNFGEAIGLLPIGSGFGSGDLSDMARAIGRLPRGTGTGSGHGVADGTLPRPQGLASGTITTLGRAIGRLPRGTFVGIGHWDNFGIAIGILPALIAVPSGIEIGFLPRGRFIGLGHWVTATVYEGYSMTFLQAQDAGAPPQIATTHLTAFPFDRIVRWQGHYYGIAATGIYLLEGELFDKAPIVATVKTMEASLGHDNRKRTRALFMAGEISDDMALEVTSNEVDTVDYTYTDPERAGPQVHRFKLGRGMVGTYLSYQFTNTQGKPFRVTKLKPEIEVLRREI